MTETIQVTPFTKVLISIMAIAFFSWAGVVWSGIESARIVGLEITSKLTRIESSLHTISDELKDHESLPWHSKAGFEINGIREQLKYEFRNKGKQE